MKLLDWTREYLARNGIGAPRLSAEVLLAHVLGCERILLYARFDHQPTPEQLAAYRELVKRAATAEPVAYLVGYKEFYSLRFKVSADVLVPRSETELLVTEAAGHLRTRGQPRAMWDVCTGSGCIAVAVAAQVDDVTVLATDISQAAVAVAEENATAHGLEPRIRCRAADLLAPPQDCDDLCHFDVITANPPYVAVAEEVAETVRHEPHVALYAGTDGLQFIRPIIADSPPFLLAGGALILEFACGQAGEVRDLLVETRAFSEPRILRDHQGIERAAVAVKT